MIKRPKKDSVLIKHKKWLSDLQKTKERLEEEYLQDLQRKDEEKQRFQENERKMRELSRSILAEAKSGSNNETGENPTTTNEVADSKGESKADSKDNKYASSSSSSNLLNNNSNNNNNNNNNNIAEAKSISSSLSSKKLNQRPAWAVTETLAQKLKDIKEEAEDEDLLAFARDLDYEKYIGDMEVKLMMDRLRRRIIDLEREVLQEEQRNVEHNNQESRAARREMLELMGQAEQSLLSQQRGMMMDEQQLAMNTAKALLEEEDDMQAVHSTKSVVALLKSAKEKIHQVQNAVKKTEVAEAKVTNEVSD
jgi:hypothetical protein